MGRGRHFAGAISESPQESDLEGLRAYEAVENAAANRQSSGQKQDLNERKFAFDQTQKQAELEQRAKAAETTAQLRGEQLESLKSIREAREATMEANLAKQDLLAQHTTRVATAATNIFKAIGTLDNTAPDYKAKLFQTLADNPDAANHPEVMKAVTHEMETYDRRQDLQSKAVKANPTLAFQDALAASQPIYGVADANGKNFNATQAGQSDQTHVQTTYLPPGAKNPVTQVFPRSVFDAAVAASAARNLAQPTPAPAPAPAPANGAPAAPEWQQTSVPDQSFQTTRNAPQIAQVPPLNSGVPQGPMANGATADAPNIPPSAIDYLTKNPNVADQFEAKYGVGTAKPYLGGQ